MSCIDLIFCTNQSVISIDGADVSVFDKCHHNIIYGKINIRVPHPPTESNRKQYLTLIGIKLLKIFR